MNMVAHSSSNPLRFSFGKKYQEPWFPQFCSLSLHPYSYTICDGCIAAEDRSSAPLVFVQDDKSKITSHRKDHFMFRDHGRSVYNNVNVDKYDVLFEWYTINHAIKQSFMQWIQIRYYLWMFYTLFCYVSARCMGEFCIICNW